MFNHKASYVQDDLQDSLNLFTIVNTKNSEQQSHLKTRYTFCRE